MKLRLFPIVDRCAEVSHDARLLLPDLLCAGGFQQVSGGEMFLGPRSIFGASILPRWRRCNHILVKSSALSPEAALS
jgi:hypothetical protein